MLRKRAAKNLGNVRLERLEVIHYEAGHDTYCKDLEITLANDTSATLVVAEWNQTFASAITKKHPLCLK